MIAHRDFPALYRRSRLKTTIPNGSVAAPDAPVEYVASALARSAHRVATNKNIFANSEKHLLEEGENLLSERFQKMDLLLKDEKEESKSM